MGFCRWFFGRDQTYDVMKPPGETSPQLWPVISYNGLYMALGQTLIALVNINIAGIYGWENPT